jgi:hypothetical protein
VSELHFSFWAYEREVSDGSGVVQWVAIRAEDEIAGVELPHIIKGYGETPYDALGSLCNKLAARESSDGAITEPA